MAYVVTRGDRPATVLAATLDHLVLTSPAPAALAEFYRCALGYRTVAEGPAAIIATAADRKLAFASGKAKALKSAGYRVADAQELARLRARLDELGVAHTDGPTLLFDDAVLVRDPDGNRFAFGIARPQHDSACHDGATYLPPARLQHLVIASRDPARIVAFFVDALGFTLSDEVLDEAGVLRTAFLRCSDEHHSFAVFKAPENRLDHHCYETSDWNAIRDWCDHMAGERIALSWGPGRHGPGNNLFMFINDPDGNWLEISAELELVSHDRPVGHWPHEERTLNSWGQAFLRS